MRSMCVFFFFKQKTAYEMRISDWSSDVCSSDLQIFKLTDPASGRLLGLRADMTPQAARIAARHYADQKIVRLCYLGTVLRSQAGSLGGPRSPRQVGCEIFGEAGVAADLEVLLVLLNPLQLAGMKKVHHNLGHARPYHPVDRTS